MTNADMLAFLGGLGPLTGLSSATVETLGRGAQQVTVQAGRYLFREGDPANFLFIVKRGAFEVRKRSDDGTELTVREMAAGEVGGLTSMHLEKTRSATLHALTECVVAVIPREVFLQALRSHPDLSQALFAHLSRKVRDKSQTIATLLSRVQRDPRMKIALFDAKPYEKTAFEAHLHDDLRAQYFEARLGPTTVALARGFPVVCAFVNDELSAPVIQQLAAGGTSLIAMRCAGYNNVDLAAAAQAGLSVVRVPAYSPFAVAEHAVALIMALNRKTHRAYNRVREGNFSLAGLVGFDLHGRTAGIVGLGKIGRCLANILRGFGMTVLAHDPMVSEAEARDAGVRAVGLDELLASSDIVSLHSPLMPETHHLVNAERIAKMKPGAMLINTSRGGLVDAAALIDGLKSGHIGAAGLDVYEEESEYFFQDRSDRVITDDFLARLMTFNNVIVTSHQAFLTSDALDNIAETTLGNIRSFLGGARGAELSNLVAAVC
jgi:D-lactate dehydrogenase